MLLTNIAFQISILFSDEDLDFELSSNPLNRKSSLLPDDEFSPDHHLKSDEIHHNGVAYKHDLVRSI